MSNTKKILQIFFLLALGTLSACSKGPRNTDVSSSEFVFTPLAAESPEAREMGRALILIRRAEGGLGTGFFISPDGLFVTNEHVLPRSRCSSERCAGLQLVRNFTHHGDFEVFNQVQILASDAELDFTLGRVISKSPVRVPYLKLASLSDADNLTDASLKVFGHPFGSSVHTLTARFVGESDGKMHLRSPVLPGNSGGPVVDLRSRKVIGLINEMLFHVENADRDTGAFENSAQAIEMGAIRNALAKAFPLSDGAEELNLAMFEKPQIASPDMFRDLLPKTREEALAANPPNVSAYVAQILGTPDEKKSFGKSLILISKMAGKSAAALNFLKTLLDVQLQRGGEIRDNSPFEPLAALIDKKQFESNLGREIKSQLEVWTGAKQRTVCLNEKQSEPSLLEQLRYAGAVCRSKNLSNGSSVFSTLSAYYQQFHAEFENKKGLARMAINIISQQLKLQVPSSEEVAEIDKILENIENHSRAKGLALEAEGTRCILQTNPKLISHGAFAESF